jgi:hypothetical protein
MALLGDRLIIRDSIDFFSSGLIEKGQVVVTFTGSGGAGVGLDDADAYCFVASTASGTKPVGIALQDAVNKDLTQTHLNFHKEEVQTGAKICLLQDGWCVTDQISGTPKAGDEAYLANSGLVTPTFSNASASPRVGSFKTKKNADGFAAVYVRLPY